MTYPAKLRLVLKDEYSGKYTAEGEPILDEDGPLGFIHPYEPEKKTWESKCRTQDDWAYSPARYVQGGVLCRKYHEWKKVDGKYQTVIRDEPVPQWLLPQIIDNVPQVGFKMAGSVKRWSTGNKLWRVRDPRGFQLEISTENFAEIVMSTTVTKGLLDGSYVWHKEGNKTVQLIRV